MKSIISTLAAVLLFSMPLRAEEHLHITSLDGHFTMETQSQLAESPVGKFVEVTFSIHDENGNAITGADIAIDGGMLAHGHGLPTRPEVNEIGDGRYMITGLKFSMFGAWRLVLDIQSEDVTDRILIEFEL